MGLTFISFMVPIPSIVHQDTYPKKETEIGGSGTVLVLSRFQLHCGFVNMSPSTRLFNGRPLTVSIEDAAWPIVTVVYVHPDTGQASTVWRFSILCAKYRRTSEKSCQLGST